MPRQIKRGLLFLLKGDIDAQANVPTVGRRLLQHAQPSAVVQLLLENGARAEVNFHPVPQPVFLTSDGIGILPVRQPEAQNIFEFRTRGHGFGGDGVDLAVAVVAGQQPVVPVKQHKPVGYRLQCGPDPHLFGDVQGETNHVAIAGSSIDQPHPLTVGKLDGDGGGAVFVPPRHHGGNPRGRGLILKDDQAFFRDKAQNFRIADARRHIKIDKRGQVGAVGHPQPHVSIKHREAIKDRVDRIAQPAFGHDGGRVRGFEVGQKAGVLAFQHLCFGQGSLCDVALLDNLVRQ